MRRVLAHGQLEHRQQVDVTTPVHVHRMSDTRGPSTYPGSWNMASTFTSLSHLPHYMAPPTLIVEGASGFWMGGGSLESEVLKCRECAEVA